MATSAVSEGASKSLTFLDASNKEVSVAEAFNGGKSVALYFAGEWCLVLFRFELVCLRFCRCLVHRFFCGFGKIMLPIWRSQRLHIYTHSASG